MAKFQVVETDQYQNVGEEFEAGDMCEALDRILREHGITVHEVDEEEDTNSHITILNHDISYHLEDGSEIEDGDCEHEHIVYMINGGYCEGELNKTDPNDPENNFTGYWSIVRGN